MMMFAAALEVRNVLVVDDTRDALDLVAIALRRCGHRVETAENGREALDALEHFVPDVIVLDLMMPVLDGLSFLEILRRDPRWASTRVIVLTGYGMGINTQRLTELGVGEILLKGATNIDRVLDLVEAN